MTRACQPRSAGGWDRHAGTLASHSSLPGRAAACPAPARSPPRPETVSLRRAWMAGAAGPIPTGVARPKKPVDMSRPGPGLAISPVEISHTHKSAQAGGGWRGKARRRQTEFSTRLRAQRTKRTRKNKSRLIVWSPFCNFRQPSVDALGTRGRPGRLVIREEGQDETSGEGSSVIPSPR